MDKEYLLIISKGIYILGKEWECGDCGNEGLVWGQSQAQDPNSRNCPIRGPYSG